MKTIQGNIVLKRSNINQCCFCDAPLNHIKKTKLGKVYICKCGASFIWPKKTKEDFKNVTVRFQLA